MCIKQNHIWNYRRGNWEKIRVPCRRCWACLKNKTNDIVGRALCEAQTSEWCWMVNLTYRPHDKPFTPAALAAGNQTPTKKFQTQVIQKADFQAFMKHLRHSCTIRYLVAGEFGTNYTKRTHFHVILFGTGPRPTWEPLKNIHVEHWPYGHIYVDQNVNERRLRYVASYATKRLRKKTNENTSLDWFSYSKKPLLGFQTVIDMANRYADERVLPHSFQYRPPFSNPKNKYTFYGVAQELFFDQLFMRWPQAQTAPRTEAMENAFRRYSTIKTNKFWNKLPPSIQKKYIDANYRVGVNKVDKPPLPDHMIGKFLIETAEKYGTTVTDTLKLDPSLRPIFGQATRPSLN